jgi:hypothetical protein
LRGISLQYPCSVFVGEGMQIPEADLRCVQE